MLSRKLGLNLFWAGFLAGASADLLTYLGTSVGLATGLHAGGNLVSEIVTIFTILSPYVAALMIIEGAITGGILVYVRKHRPDILLRLRILKREEPS